MMLRHVAGKPLLRFCYVRPALSRSRLVLGFLSFCSSWYVDDCLLCSVTGVCETGGVVAKILKQIDKLKADMCFLQETHNKTLITYRHHSLNISFLQILSQDRVAILINKNISFNHNDTITAPKGRFIIINITINSPKTTAKVY